MKITNFKPTGVIKPLPSGLFDFLLDIETATVDVSTGFLWWKKTVTRKIYKASLFWRWADNGEFTPGDKVEALVSRYAFEQSHNRYLELACAQS